MPARDFRFVSYSNIVPTIGKVRTRIWIVLTSWRAPPAALLDGFLFPCTHVDFSFFVLLNSKFVKKFGLPFLKLLHGLLDACEIIQSFHWPLSNKMTTSLSVAMMAKSEMGSCYATNSYYDTHLIIRVSINMSLNRWKGLRRVLTYVTLLLH